MCFSKDLLELIIDESDKAQKAYILSESLTKVFPHDALEEKQWALGYLQKYIKYTEKGDVKKSTKMVDHIRMSFMLSELYSLHSLMVFLYSSHDFFDENSRILMKNVATLKDNGLTNPSYKEKFKFESREDALDFFKKNEKWILSHIDLLKNAVVGILKENDADASAFLNPSKNLVALNDAELDLVCKRLISVMDDYYLDAMGTIYDLEVKYGTKFAFVNTELRGFVHHLRESVLSPSIDVALGEIENGAEHLRRAAVEALQQYMNDLMAAISNHLFSLCEDASSVISKYPIIYSNFRYKKSRKAWKDAISLMASYKDELTAALENCNGTVISIL